MTASPPKAPPKPPSGASGPASNPERERGASLGGASRTDTAPEGRPTAALAVTVDGEALAPDAARAFWQRFSTYMDEHKGDLAGFARAEGFTSVHPRMGPNGAVLVASRHAVQAPYDTAKGVADGPLARPRGGASSKASTMDAGRSKGGSGGGGARGGKPDGPRKKRGGHGPPKR